MCSSARNTCPTALLLATGLQSTPCLSSIISLTAGDPRVIIYLQPPGVTPLGGSAVIHCEYQCNGGTFVLYRSGEKISALKPYGKRAEFLISNVEQGNAGRYICQCYIKQTPPAWSSLSEFLELVVRGETLPHLILPSFSLLASATSWGKLEKRKWGKENW
uniref:Immunoglobulin domain-containing protein n=1 Tax=Nothoprocta perdicaria TaxID=30464 RepID=A0A8C7E9M8_NOTPE